MNTQLDHNTLEPSGELANTIRDFRSAVTHVADRETARPVAADWLAPARHRRHRARQTMMLAWGCAALLCLAMLPLSLRSHRGAALQPSVATATSAAKPSANESDNALLEQVDTDVAETVPAPLQPLAEMETWNSDSTSTSASNSASRSSANGSAAASTENH